MRHLVSILGLALSLSSCAHLESTVSQGGDAPLNGFHLLRRFLSHRASMQW